MIALPLKNIMQIAMGIELNLSLYQRSLGKLSDNILELVDIFLYIIIIEDSVRNVNIFLHFCN